MYCGHALKSLHLDKLYFECVVHRNVSFLQELWMALHLSSS